MVAISGKWGRLAPSLVDMWREANAIAPNRRKASDGSVGDLAHAARSSFHNPSSGFVDALDLTNDPAGGFDVHKRARELVGRGDDRLDHVISNRMIWSQARPYWRAYTGSNPHTLHAHFAVRRNAAGRTPGAWWPTKPKPAPTPPEEDDDMAVAVKSEDDPRWWAVTAIGRRHLVSRQDAAEDAFLGLLKVKSGNSPETIQPFIWPQKMIDKRPRTDG